MISIYGLVVLADFVVSRPRGGDAKDQRILARYLELKFVLSYVVKSMDNHYTDAN